MSGAPDEDIDRGWFTAGVSGRPSDELGAVPPSDGPAAGMPPEQWERLLQTLRTFEREITASVDPRRRAALCYEVGRLHEQALGDDRRAILFYQRAFRYDPSHLPTLQAGRRVFGRAGKWRMVVHLLDAEVKARPSPAERARLLCEKGDLYLTRFGRPGEARACFAAALAQVPGDAAVARRLANAAALAGDRAGFAEAALLAADGCADEAVARGLRVEAAEALLALGRSEAAAPLLAAVVQGAPAHPRAHTLLARAHRAVGRWDAYVEAVRGAAARIADPPRRARELVRLAEVCVARLDDPLTAADLLAEAAAADPDSTEALAGLVDLRERLGAWEAAAEALASLIERTPDARARVDQRWRLATLRLERLDDVAGAVEALRALLADDPRWLPALELLGRLLLRMRDWESLVAMHRAELAVADDARQRAALHFRLAEIQELHRHDWVAAAEHYREAARLDPAFQYATKALARMLLRLGDWAGYVALLEEEVARAEDVEARVDLLSRLAEVWALHLDEPERAIAAWRRVLDLRPADHDAIRGIARLCAAAGRWAELLAVNELELGQLHDERKLLALLMRSAEICERHLDDGIRARAYLQRALDLDPGFLPALQALGRLCHRQGAWADLVELHHREIEAAGSGPEAVDLHFRVGRILHEHLRDREGAIKAYEAALELSPDHLPAMRALGRLYAEAGDHAREAELLVAEVEHAPDPRAQAALLHRLGALYRHRLAQPDLAADAWHRALALDPGCRPAMAALVEAHEARGEHDALAAMHRRLANAAVDDDEAVEHLLEVARICLDHLGSVVEAVDACEEVLRRDPHHVGALLTLERLYIGSGELAELVEIYGRLAEGAADPATRADFLARRARIRADHLQAPALALEDHRAALAADPQRAESLAWVEAHAVEREDVELLAQVLARRLEQADTPREREAILLRAGSVLRARGRLTEAARCYEAILAVDPESAIALRALREVYVDLGRGEQALRLAEAEGRVARDPTNAAALLVEAGSFREADREGEAEALADYLTALERNPADEAALTAVRRLCRRAGRWEELVAALRQHAEAVPARRPELLQECAQLLAGRLAKPAEAIAALDALVAEQPDEPALLQRTADLYAELEAWPQAADVYERLRAVSPDAALRRAVLFRLAALYEDKLSNPGAARMCLNEVVEAMPDDLDALARLARLDEARHDFDAAIRLLERAVAAAESPVRAAPLQRRLAALQVVVGHQRAAVGTLEAAVAARPGDLDLLADFGALCARVGQARRLRAAYREAIEARAADAPEVALTLRRDMAVRAVEAGEEPAALEELDELARLLPQDLGLRQARARALLRSRADAREAAAEFRWLVGREPFELDHLRALRRLDERLAEPDRAYELARLLNALGAGGDEDAHLIEAWHPRVRRWPARPLSEAERARSWPEDQRFADVLRALAARLPALLAPPGGPAAAPPAELQGLANRIAGLLGLDEVPLRLDRRPPGQVSSAADGTVVFGEALARMSQGEQSFLLAAGLELHARGLSVVTRWSPTALRGLLEALAALGGHPVEPVALGRDTAEARAAALHARLGPAVVEDLAEPLSALRALLPSLDVAAARAAFLAAAHRTALLLCGGILPAVRALQKVAAGGDAAPPPPQKTAGVADLVRWLVADPYYELRQSLGLAPEGG